MAIALRDELSALSADVRNILLDDLVSALESRLKVLVKVESNYDFKEQFKQTVEVSPTIA